MCVDITSKTQLLKDDIYFQYHNHKKFLFINYQYLAGGEALPIHDLPQSQLMETEEEIIGHGAAEAHLNIDDILVMKPSFEGQCLSI